MSEPIGDRALADNADAEPGSPEAAALAMADYIAAKVICELAPGMISGSLPEWVTDVFAAGTHSGTWYANPIPCGQQNAGIAQLMQRIDPVRKQLELSLAVNGQHVWSGVLR